MIAAGEDYKTKFSVRKYPCSKKVSLIKFTVLLRWLGGGSFCLEMMLLRTLECDFSACALLQRL